MKHLKCVFPIAFLLLCILSQSSSARAQAMGAANPTRRSHVLPKLYAGVKFGANFSYLSGRDWENGVKSNLVSGLYAGVKGVGFGFQMEGLFEQSDYISGNSFHELYRSYYNDLRDSLQKGTFRVNKLCLPVLLQMRVSRLFWLQAGVQFYGVVSVRDNARLLKDAKELFRSGSTAGLLGATIHIGNADLGGRFVFDFNNLNNIYSAEVWRQYMLQFHVGVKLF